MKRFILFSLVAVLAASCSMPSRLLTTSSYDKAYVNFQPTTVVADVKVSDVKVTYMYVPTKNVLNGGPDNVKSAAVSEALQSAGNYDVLVAMETQIKYSSEGEIESVLVMGYPGKYVNWRSTE